MTFPEARDYQGALSDLSVQDKLASSGRVRGGIKQLNKGLYQDVRDAAETKGLGNDFDKAMKTYRQASQLKSAGKTLGKAAGVGLLGAGGYHFGKDLLGK